MGNKFSKPLGSSISKLFPDGRGSVNPVEIKLVLMRTKWMKWKKRERRERKKRKKEREKKRKGSSPQSHLLRFPKESEPVVERPQFLESSPQRFVLAEERLLINFSSY